MPKQQSDRDDRHDRAARGQPTSGRLDRGSNVVDVGTGDGGAVGGEDPGVMGDHDNETGVLVRVVQRGQSTTLGIADRDIAADDTVAITGDEHPATLRDRGVADVDGRGVHERGRGRGRDDRGRVGDRRDDALVPDHREDVRAAVGAAGDEHLACEIIDRTR